MNENLDPTTSGYNSEEFDLEKKLRPLSFDDFAGQDQILENLKVFVEAANQRNEALDHTLFMVLRVWARLLWLIYWLMNYRWVLKLLQVLFR
jgi:hypothetical protein